MSRANLAFLYLSRYMTLLATETICFAVPSLLVTCTSSKANKLLENKSLKKRPRFSNPRLEVGHNGSTCFFFGYRRSQKTIVLLYNHQRHATPSSNVGIRMHVHIVSKVQKVIIRADDVPPHPQIDDAVHWHAATCRAKNNTSYSVHEKRRRKLPRTLTYMHVVPIEYHEARVALLSACTGAKRHGHACLMVCHIYRGGARNLFFFIIRGAIILIYIKI